MEIDEFGIVSKRGELQEKDEKLVDFKFTIEKNMNGYVLIGKEGTAWEKLTFSFPRKHARIYQYGVFVQ